MPKKYFYFKEKLNHGYKLYNLIVLQTIKLKLFLFYEFVNLIIFCKNSNNKNMEYFFLLNRVLLFLIASLHLFKQL